MCTNTRPDTHETRKTGGGPGGVAKLPDLAASDTHRCHGEDGPKGDETLPAGGDETISAVVQFRVVGGLDVISNISGTGGTPPNQPLRGKGWKRASQEKYPGASGLDSQSSGWPSLGKLG